MKRVFITLALIGITAAYSANLYNRKIKIDYPQVDVYLSKDCANIVDMDDLRIFEKQIAKLPNPIPRIKFYQSEEILEPGLQNSINKTRSLTLESQSKNIQQIFIAYQPGQTYGLGNVIGKVFASNSGLILLNDIRIAQAYDYDKGFVANLIIHEVLHIYGLDHANGLGSLVKNKPVMSLGKQSPTGISFDDKAGLLENYNAKTKMSSVSLNTNGNVVALVGKKSQAKNAIDGSVTFTHVPSGKYKLFVDSVQIRKLVVK
jgi:hypothetical protein